MNVAKLGSKAENLLSGKREGEGREKERETETDREREVRLGPNLEQPQGISYLERKMERYIV